MHYKNGTSVSLSQRECKAMPSVIDGCPLGESKLQFYFTI